MLTRYICYTGATGEITSLGTNESELVPFLVEKDRGDAYISDVGPEVTQEGHYVVDGYLVERPTLPEPASTDLPCLIDYAEYPGTTIVAQNESGSGVFVGEQLQLVEQGEYRLTITPPFPYKQLKVTLNV